MSLAPIYTAQNCKAAYQLRWSLSLFPSQALPPIDQWLDALKIATGQDHIRIPEFRLLPNHTAQFLLSTTPEIHPPAIIRSVKGRLVNLLQSAGGFRFRRNFRLTSVGEANVETVQQYVLNQLGHHPLADSRTARSLKEFSLEFEQVDLTRPVESAHGQYLIALHIVFVHAERWRISEPGFLAKSRDAILATAAKKGHRLSRLSLLPDHVHLTVGVGYETSPAEVSLSYMNNVAYRHGMLRMWMNSFYVGTIGPYDMAAVRRLV